MMLLQSNLIFKIWPHWRIFNTI